MLFKCVLFFAGYGCDCVKRNPKTDKNEKCPFSDNLVLDVGFSEFLDCLTVFPTIVLQI